MYHNSSIHKVCMKQRIGYFLVQKSSKSVKCVLYWVVSYVGLRTDIQSLKFYINKSWQHPQVFNSSDQTTYIYHGSKTKTSCETDFFDRSSTITSPCYPSSGLCGDSNTYLGG